MHNPIQCKHTNVVPTDIDHIPSNTIHSGAGATLYVFEDNEETWKTQNQHQMDFLCILVVKHLYQHLNRSRALISWCRFTHGWNSCPWSLGFGYRSIPLFSNSIKRKPKIKHEAHCVTPHQTSTPKTKLKSQPTKILLSNVDYVSSIVKSSLFGSMLYICEDSEAVIKIIMKGRIPTMGHVSRTHRVALDWIFDRTTLDPKIQIRCIDTNINSQTFWPKVISRVTNGIIFFICSTSAISAPLAAPNISAWQAAPHWRRGYKIKHKKKGLCPSRVRLHLQFRRCLEPRWNQVAGWILNQVHSTQLRSLKCNWKMPTFAGQWKSSRET